MSPSSDIETLFGHFGGNPGDYQEIGRENEASSARTRWPLLVTLDLKQPSIPAIAQPRDPAWKQAVAADPHTQVEAQQGDAQTAGPAQPEQTASALLRSKAPLFTRSHRRTIPPVGNAATKPETPRGAERFSAIPSVIEAVPGADQAEPNAVPVTAPAPVAVAAPAALDDGSSGHGTPAAAPGHAVTAPATPAIPAVAPALTPAAARPPLSATVPPVVAGGVTASATTLRTPAIPAFSARLAVPVAARQQPAAPVASVAPAMPAATAAPARAAAAAAAATPKAEPPSILGKLFAPAAPQPTPSAAAPATAESAPAPLGSVFARLRGDAGTTAAPAPHSWLTNGPRRS